MAKDSLHDKQYGMWEFESRFGHNFFSFTFLLFLFTYGCFLCYVWTPFFPPVFKIYCYSVDFLELEAYTKESLLTMSWRNTLPKARPLFAMSRGELTKLDQFSLFLIHVFIKISIDTNSSWIYSTFFTLSSANSVHWNTYS